MSKDFVVGKHGGLGFEDLKVDGWIRRWVRTKWK